MVPIEHTSHYGKTRGHLEINSQKPLSNFALLQPRLIQAKQPLQCAPRCQETGVATVTGTALPAAPHCSSRPDCCVSAPHGAAGCHLSGSHSLETHREGEMCLVSSLA